MVNELKPGKDSYMSISEVLAHRVSIDHFDPKGVVSDAQIAELVRSAQEAPSSFNIQHTRFVAVTDPAIKGRLREAAFNQAKITEAAVVFVLLGDLRAHEDYAVRIRAAAAAGHVPAGVAEYLAGTALSFYANPTASREEGLRSAGLSAMALMLAADGAGLGSCPMIGFDPEAFRKILGVPERYFPAMIVVAGPTAPNNMGRKPRLDVNEVLRINGAEFPG
jgi:nitroreductase